MSVPFMSKLAPLSDAKAAYDKAIAESGKSAIRETLEAFVAAHPRVKALRWDQYAPHFNDGDACEFSIHEPFVLLKESEADIDEDDEEEGWKQHWDLEGEWDAVARKRKPNEDPEIAAVVSDLSSLYTALQDIEEAVRAAFGDDCRVIVTTEGVTVEDVDHD